MGNAPPKNRTGKNETAQKLENAKRLGILSLTGHGLEKVPLEVLQLATKLRSLDLSDNRLTAITVLSNSNHTIIWPELKTLQLQRNSLTAGALDILSSKGMPNLNKLQVNDNSLGCQAIVVAKKKKSSQQNNTNIHKEAMSSPLPSQLREVQLAGNSLCTVPRPLLTLDRLERLDLSRNLLVELPSESSALVALVELNLDDNRLASFPASWATSKLKILSLRRNRLVVIKGQQPPCLPPALFTDTALIDLNLHHDDAKGITNTQLNDLKGFDVFLERRRLVKNKTSMANLSLSVCGLK